MLSYPPSDGQPAAQVIPINAPTRAELWARNQLALAVLSHGRIDRAELIAILSGASITELLPRSVS